MQTDDVRGAQELVEVEPLVRCIGDLAPARVHDSHVEGLGEPGDVPPDPSETDDAQGAAGKAATEHEGRRPDPGSAAPEKTIALGDTTKQVEDQRESQLGSRTREHARCVRHDHAPARRGSEIDVVVPNRVVCDDAQLVARRVQQLVVDRVSRHDQEPVLPGGQRKDIGSRRRQLRIANDQIEGRLELGDDARHHATGKVDAWHGLLSWYNFPK